MQLLLLQPPQLRPFADPRLLSHWNLLYRILQQFNETLYGRFPILRLVAGLLRYDTGDSVFADTVLQAAQNELFLISGEAGRDHYDEPQGHARAYFVNILSNLIQPWEPIYGIPCQDVSPDCRSHLFSPINLLSCDKIICCWD